MINKNGVLTISDWTKGIGASPYVGFSMLKNCDIFDTPGVLKGSLKTSLQTSTSGIPVARVKASNGDVYVLVRVEGGTSYLLKNGTSLTNVTGDAWDMIEYKGYLIIASGTVLSCYGTTNSTAFFDSFKTGLSTGYYHKLLVGQDDIVYIANGNTVATLTSFVAGTFAVAPTATLSTSALDLPEGEYISTLAELGRFLAIGTHGGGSWSAAGSQTRANVILWDRVSSSFNLPVKLNEQGVHAMVSSNNQLYVIAGTLGNIYRVDGSSYNLLKRIPWMKDNRTSSVFVYPNSLAINQNGNLLAGLSLYSGSSSDLGIYEVDLHSSDHATCLKHTTSTTSSNTSIGFVQPEYNDRLYVGWGSGSSFGVDYTTTLVPYTSYGTVAESPLYQVSSGYSKKTFQNIAITLGKPLVSAQNIRVSYRYNLYDDYTVLGTWGYSTYGTVSTITDSISITDAESLQIKIEIDQDMTASPVPAYVVELLSLNFW